MAAKEKWWQWVTSFKTYFATQWQEHKSASRRISFTLIMHDEKSLSALKGAHG